MALTVLLPTAPTHTHTSPPPVILQAPTQSHGMVHRRIYIHIWDIYIPNGAYYRHLRNMAQNSLTHSFSIWVITLAEYKFGSVSSHQCHYIGNACPEMNPTQEIENQEIKYSKSLKTWVEDLDLARLKGSDTTTVLEANKFLPFFTNQIRFHGVSIMCNEKHTDYCNDLMSSTWIAVLSNRTHKKFQECTNLYLWYMLRTLP